MFVVRLCAIILSAWGMDGFVVPLTATASSNDYVKQLQKRAHEERLAERSEWRALLHYKPRRLSQGVESQVDSDTFFLSPKGKYDPQAELDATLAGFFETGGNDPDNGPQCRFVARYQWLKQMLGFDPDKLPQIQCKRFNRWLEKMNPERLTLVFPAAYLNNPASMFGHTLLRIDAQGQDEQTRLLAHTINYAADTHQQRGFQFAFKGLTGLYQGRFSIAPYYATVKVYGDIENRDIWEYGLNLTTEEISQLLRHTWEMRTAWFDYFFLDENCSYHLLSLMEVARPGLRLTGQFQMWVIPSETVRAVAEAGMVKEVRFRPARTTVLLERARLMDSHLQVLAKRLAEGETTAGSEAMQRLTPKEQTQTIELALDYAAIRRSPRFGGAEENTAAVSELLKARSRLNAPDQTPAIPAPAVWPGEGHKPARAGIGYGFENRRHFIEITGGPAYHDILDPEGGFTHNSKVNILNAAARYYPESNHAELERFDLVDVMSLSSWNRLLHPVSWKAGLGIERKQLTDSKRLLLGRFNGGFGIGHDFSRQTSAYAFAEGKVELSDHFAYVAAPGVGPRIGIIHDVTERWRTELSFLWQFFFLHEQRHDYEAVMANRFTITRQSIAGLDLEWKREFGNSFPGIKVYWQYYF